MKSRIFAALGGSACVPSPRLRWARTHIVFVAQAAERRGERCRKEVPLPAPFPLMACGATDDNGVSHYLSVSKIGTAHPP
jgi:hypothetical protein